MSPPPLLRLALLGDPSEPLQRLLEDVLRDARVRYEFVPPAAGTVDAAVVMVTWGDEARMISAACVRAAGVPLLAILPFSDDGLGERVLDCGARSWYALDTPLALLRALLVTLAGRVAPTDDETA